jgi:hypothetical protein
VLLGYLAVFIRESFENGNIVAWKSLEVCTGGIRRSNMNLQTETEELGPRGSYRIKVSRVGEPRWNLPRARAVGETKIMKLK